ncbi:MAG: helix-turn-helix domain-containing protein [Bacteroidales bacterium]
MNIDRLYYNSDEVAMILRVSKRTLQNYRTEGKIIFYKASKKNILYKAEDIELFLKNSSCVSYQKVRIKNLLEKYIVR